MITKEPLTHFLVQLMRPCRGLQDKELEKDNKMMMSNKANGRSYRPRCWIVTGLCCSSGHLKYCLCYMLYTHCVPTGSCLHFHSHWCGWTFELERLKCDQNITLCIHNGLHMYMYAQYKWNVVNLIIIGYSNAEKTCIHVH